jgi:ketosteroid isomerase-like protein
LEALTRRSIDAYNRRDYDELVALYSSSATWDSSALGLGLYQGRSVIRTLFEDWLGAYDDLETALTEFADMGSGVTLAEYRQCGRLAGSTGLVDFRFVLVTTWSDGLVDRVATYTDIDEARAEAGRLAQEGS